MADSKYGRLFTERDAIEMVRVCLTMQPNGPQGDVARRIAEHAVREWPSGTFPPDEPLFLLRGQDALAPTVVREYALLADDPSAVPLEHRRSAWDAADGMREWQAQHPDRVKVPD